jgi:hypothetical protein
VINCVALAVHPLAAVTVTEYKPGVETVSVAFVPMAFVPFSQVYVPPPVALNEIVGFVHVRIAVAGGIIVAFVGVVFCVMECTAVDVHPFGLVTVTVYSPGEVTEREAFVPTTAIPFDQEYVPPPAAVNGMLVVIHVSTVDAGVLIDAIGEVMF